MSDTETEPGAGKGRRADPEVRLTNDVAHALWQAQIGVNLPKEPEARKAAWKEAKKASIQTARLLMKRMAKKGMTVTRTGAPDDAAEMDEADA